MSDIVPEAIEAYIEAHTSERAAVFHDLARETREKMAAYMMQVGKVEGAFLKLLAQITGAKRTLEIGTFTGYSALCLAEGMPDDGHVITCDIDPEATEMARSYWAQSPHGAKIELRLGPALDTIKTLEGPFDLVFIDADKPNYIHYWEAVLPKVRQGGVIAADNVLWSGRVVDPRDELDLAMDRFNKHVYNDPRAECVMLSVRDGITLARKM
ncbi:MAG: methyltransferase domain-containing protein [Candidatus Hydrogenedentes bacterium]|nr:methyltransferase domain-containing protein [Candidatus Hydrogenedentota bacterium]